jgi:hypothetical protein
VIGKVAIVETATVAGAASTGSTMPEWEALCGDPRCGREARGKLGNPEDGWFTCVVHDPSHFESEASYSPVRPDPNSRPLDNILGETTLEGILRVLEIPGELLGL